MNLTPAANRRRFPTRRRSTGADGRRRAGAVLLGSLLVVGVVAAGLLERRGLDRQRAAAEAEVRRLQGAAQQHARTQGRLAAALEARAAAARLDRRLARWDEERGVVAQLLRGLSRRLGPEAVLDTIRRDGVDLELTGRALSGEAVSAAVRDLGRLDRVFALDLLYVERAETGATPQGDEFAAETAAQRFAARGLIRYVSPEPDPFEIVAPTRAR